MYAVVLKDFGQVAVH